MKDNKEGLKEAVQSSMFQKPQVEESIEVTEKSHPFASMAYARIPFDLAECGYYRRRVLRGRICKRIRKRW